MTQDLDADWREQVSRVYTRGYDNAYFLGNEGEYGQKAGIAAGVYAVAEWARREALKEAQSAVARCGYVIDTDRAAFPSQRAVDQWEALDAIRDLDPVDDYQPSPDSEPRG